jgi:hypothetical protein
MSPKKKLKTGLNERKMYFTNLCIPIKSSTSEDTYNVFINYDNIIEEYEFKCTCGLKFNVGLRVKCKHISFIKEHLSSQLNVYSLDNCDNDQLLSQFSNLTV